MVEFVGTETWIAFTNSRTKHQKNFDALFCLFLSVSTIFIHCLQTNFNVTLHIVEIARMFVINNDVIFNVLFWKINCASYVNGNQPQFSGKSTIIGNMLALWWKGVFYVHSKSGMDL